MRSLPDVLLLGRLHGGIELDENLAGLDALPVLNVDGAHNAGLERLDDLDAAAGNDLAGRRGDDIDMAEARPEQGQAEQAMMSHADCTPDRRRRRLDDFQRRRQEGKFVLRRVCRLRQGDDVLRA